MFKVNNPEGLNQWTKKVGNRASQIKQTVGLRVSAVKTEATRRVLDAKRAYNAPELKRKKSVVNLSESAGLINHKTANKIRSKITRTQIGRAGHALMTGHGVYEIPRETGGKREPGRGRKRK